MAIVLSSATSSRDSPPSGLDIALDKTEVIPACSASQTFSSSDFPLVAPGPPLEISSFSGNRSGTGSGVSHSSRKRVVKASALIRAVGRWRDAHGAFKILRSCAGWAKILFSCRTVPPSLKIRRPGSSRLPDQGRPWSPGRFHIVGR